ncbi:universal stress protein [Aliihoeflea sp. 40Bstr573]|uniref:universal stress protein n=1 Tax=Aliihoeflea sp. 40Bstr573 TaxID=2696467 RepID=UPI0020957932|nr:universal stress protein [Aliihoeflea sp. 40Bstr573]MCO6389115.1 universal stress protein [Aliihoeflea sp. 40Bstr573]
MAFKDIVVFADTAPSSLHRLRIAADLAQRYAAHLIGVYVVPSVGHSHDGYARGESIRSVAEHRREKEERSVLEVGRQFADLARRHDIQAELRLILNSEVDQNVMLNSLYADLAIVGQTEPHGLPQNWLPDHLLLASSVPVLVVPNAWRADKIGDRIVVAWNASKEARRATTDALPLLSMARSVKILIVDADSNADRHGEEPGANIARHLARHGAQVEVEQLRSNGTPVADVVLSAASTAGADLIVMGGHSHSRSRQLLFGSVTRVILTGTTMPVLISR